MRVKVMTTAEPQHQWAPNLDYISDEYDVIRNGRTFRCRKFELFGEEYETGYVVGPSEDVLKEMFPEPFVGPDSPIYDDLVAYLDRFLEDPAD